MPTFRFEIQERHVLEVEAPSASELFWNYGTYAEQAEFISTRSSDEPEHIEEVKE